MSHLIDSSVDHNSLPEWLKRGKVNAFNSPQAVARDIRYHLNEFLLERQHPVFFNRDREKEELADILKPIDTSEPPPHIVFIHGFPGYGRRSFVRNRTPELLNIRKFVYFKIGSGYSINDICSVVADEIEPYNTMDGLRRIVNEILSLSEADAIQRLKSNLTKIVSNGELPIFVDEGGLLDLEGYLQDPIKRFLSSILPSEPLYVFFISYRNPKFETVFYPVIKVGRLPERDTKRFISELARFNELKLSPGEIDELSQYTAGYPPAAIYSIREAKEYGIDVVLKAKEILIRYRTSVFMKHIADAHLIDAEKSFLRILAFFSPLPASTIIEVVSINDKDAVNAIMRLIDYSFITTTSDGHYQIAEPIAETVSHMFGMPDGKQIKTIATSLVKYLNDSKLEVKRLEISRVLFRVAKLSRNAEAEKLSIHLANDLIRLTIDSYHDGRYDDVIAYGRAALIERPDNGDARKFLIRALIKNEQWSEAEQEIRIFEKYINIREILFLKGFLERKRRNFNLALTHFTEAVKRKRSGVDIMREMAECQLLAGDIDGALKSIKNALSGDDAYIVDLWVRILIKQQNRSAAQGALDRLKLLDKSRYYFRLSRFQGLGGDYSSAEKSAKEALETRGKPPLEFRAQHIYCLIRLCRADEAREALDELDRDFRNVMHDMRLSLRCHLENCLKHYREALRLSEKIRSKQDIYYKKIRKDALEGVLNNDGIPDDDRKEYQIELDRIKQELSTSTISDEVPFD